MSGLINPQMYDEFGTDAEIFKLNLIPRSVFFEITVNTTCKLYRHASKNKIRTNWIGLDIVTEKHKSPGILLFRGFLF